MPASVLLCVFYTGKKEDLAATLPDFAIVRGRSILVEGKIDMDFTGIQISEIV